MLTISNETRILCGIAMICVPAVQVGGLFLLWLIRNNAPGYLDNPLRQAFFRAGHAHAGVLLILSLISQILVDSIVIGDPFRWLIRLAIPSAAILMPLGFFLSVASPQNPRPNSLVGLIYLGALVLALGVLLLGFFLLRAGTVTWFL